MGDEMHEGSDHNDHQHNDHDNGGNNDDLIHPAVNYDKYHRGGYNFHGTGADHDFILDRACTDDDCWREHYYVFTGEHLAARDNDQYDAGYNAGHYAAERSLHRERGEDSRGRVRDRGVPEQHGDDGVGVLPLPGDPRNSIDPAATEHAANVGWPAIDAHLARNWSEFGGVADVARGSAHSSRGRSDGHHPQDHVTWEQMEQTIEDHFDAWENEFDPGVAISARDGCTGGLLVAVGISLVMWAGLIAGTVSLWQWIS